jgi:hypothetical protein
MTNHKSQITNEVAGAMPKPEYTSRMLDHERTGYMKEYRATRHTTAATR